MPRKVSKTDKPALLFLERPVGGAKLQNVPEVRAALNPRDFFPDTQTQDSSSFNSWVNPQFSCTVAPAPPLRRSRRRCQSATSILDSCSQLSRKNSVCKFPTLSFQTVSKDQCHKLNSARTKRSADFTAVTDVRNQPQGPHQKERTLLRQCRDAPRRQLAKSRERNTELFSAASHRVEIQERPSIEVTGRNRIPADDASTPTSNDFCTTEVSSVDPPSDVGTPKVRREGSSCPSSPSVHILLAQSSSPPCNQPLDILVPDTPERDYGVKVTWRRRRSLMLMLKERGHLSESATLIHSMTN